MVCSALESVTHAGESLKTLKILDPACGDGIFLWLAFRFLCERFDATDPASKLAVLREQIFGVDLDADAIDQLRSRFLAEFEEIPSDKVDQTEVLRPQRLAFDSPSTDVSLLGQKIEEFSVPESSPVHLHCDAPPNVAAFQAVLHVILQTNFRVGNAVSGQGWESDTALNLAAIPDPAAPRFAAATLDGVDTHSADRRISWSIAFPEVKRAGGFDVIFANPPYRRERGAKLELVNIETSPLGKARHAARMDLWHYFFHRSLDLLRPGGTFSLIVNSAWTKSQAGQPITTRLEAETTPLEFVLLERAPVFEDVDGRHLILRLKKEVTNSACQIWKLEESFFPDIRTSELWNDLLACSLGQTPCDAFDGFQLARREIFQSGRLWLHPPKANDTRNPDQACLSNQFDVRQGIAENPPRITRKHAASHTGWKIGQGVFLLSAEELAALDLTLTERQVVRPYFEAAVIDRYWLPAEPTGWLLYLNRHTAPVLEDLPHIAKHLGQFRTLLEQRRETRQGKLAWWHLHWPREARLFDGPKIFAVQMGRYPRFVYVHQPAYVGFSINLAVERVENVVNSAEQGSTFSTLTLPALTAILNSKFAADWFDHHAKRRGVHFDITGGTLKQFPLPREDRDLALQLDVLSQLRSQLESKQRQAPEALSSDARDLERQIDALVQNWYDDEPRPSG
jgi:adenine-specific DNA-methyltransferase